MADASSPPSLSSTLGSSSNQGLSQIRLPISGRMRVGLFGGSFNPAHQGHAHVAETALKRLKLDKLIWLVSPQNPLKDARQTAPLATRVAGAFALVHGRRMVVSDIETRLGSAYTVDTIRALKRRYPRVRFVWIMGSDNLATFHRWKGWVEIFRTVPVLVVARPGGLIHSRFAAAFGRFRHARLPARSVGRLADATPPAWIYLAGPLNSASSTAIRAARP